MDIQKKAKPKKGEYEINDEVIFDLKYTLVKPEEEEGKKPEKPKEE